ncbi:MAG: hypothetical protein ACLSA2_04025 [Candidatus Gastranaerophilaceae bacterium]|nr:unknown [Clostridium sp. CAG:967]
MTGPIKAIGFGEKTIEGFGSLPVDANNKKVKKFEEELLQSGLSGTPIKTAYMPDIGNIGGLLGGKGSGQAATQV